LPADDRDIRLEKRPAVTFFKRKSPFIRCVHTLISSTYYSYYSAGIRVYYTDTYALHYVYTAILMHVFIRVRIWRGCACSILSYRYIQHLCVGIISILYNTYLVMCIYNIYLYSYLYTSSSNLAVFHYLTYCFITRLGACCKVSGPQ